MGKSSISMGHLYHGYVSYNQRVSTVQEGNYKSLLEYIQWRPHLSDGFSFGNQTWFAGISTIYMGLSENRVYSQ